MTVTDYRGTERQKNKDKDKIIENLTMLGSNSLASCRKCQRFPYSQFAQMKIMLTDIGSSVLWYEFIHTVAIVCHVTKKLQEPYSK